MPATKYQKYFQLMKEYHCQEFEKFAEVHHKFETDPEHWANTFHSEGMDIKDIIHHWERKLCSGTEKGKYAQYSAQLAEKFWQEVRAEFPLIDQVGLRPAPAKSRLRQ